MAKERDGSINIYGSLQAKTEDGYVAYTDGIAHENEDGTKTPLDQLLKDSGGIIDVDKLPTGGWSGTAVPCDGTFILDEETGAPSGIDGGTVVQDLYLNTNLTVDEVVKILDSINNWISTNEQGSGIYIAFFGLSASIQFHKLVNSQNEKRYAIVCENIDGTNAYFYSSADLGDVGWNLELSLPIEVNSASGSELTGFKLGVDNDKITALFSTTPFVYEEGNINDKAIYRLKEEDKDIILGYKGTVVQNSGVLEKLYFNTSLSNGEVITILNNISWTNASVIGQSGFEFYPVLAYMNGSYPYVLAFKKYDDGTINCGIINFATMAIEQIFYISEYGGWEEFENPYPINATLLSELSGIPLGTQNDKLSSLISTTPFEIEYGNKYTYWVYKDKWVQLLKNEDEYIVIEKTGDFISEPASISFNNTEFDIIQSNDKVLVKITLNESLRVIFYKNANDESDTETERVYLSANLLAYTYHLLINRDKETKEITTDIVITDLVNKTRIEGFYVTEQGSGPILMLHVLDQLGDSLYYSVPLKTEIEKDSIEIPTTGAVYNALNKKQDKITITENDDGTVDITIPTE